MEDVKRLGFPLLIIVLSAFLSRLLETYLHGSFVHTLMVILIMMDDKPSKIAEAIRIARRTIANARQNVIFAIVVKALVLLLASVGVATMGMAVFADVGVMVLCVLNSMRTLRV